ncbi:MAG: sigma-70 family RNA polymerase sigma factor [Caulobacteraceae bacterium]|nr:sigma-70 family RNA polymerase sigma factor [Caulobacteraceae bacterium]
MTRDAIPRTLSAVVEEAKRFDAFVRRFKRPLQQYFRKRGLDRADAEDLTQTALLRLLQKMRREPEVLSDGYVFTTASCVLIDHHRHRATRHLDETVEIDLETASSEPLADKILEGRQTLRVMLGVLKKMRPKMRRAFELHRFESLSYEEIARRMGVSVSSVEKYVMAALAELRGPIDRDRHV